MKAKHNRIRTILALMPLALILSGCPSLVTMLPSMVPSMVPSVNLNNVNVNNNQISCYAGGWFSSGYCSIPLSNFIGISSHYADPYDVNLLLNYDVNNQQFFFDTINDSATIDKLNQNFLSSYPNVNQFAALPTKIQSLYIKMKEEYIPKQDYANLYKGYIYIYTISALHFATAPCDESMPLLSNKKMSIESYQQQIMLHKAFAMQYSNAVLHYVAGELSDKYNDETKLYNSVYSKILTLNPYQLQNMAQSLYSRINSFAPAFNASFYTLDGVSFGDLGKFSCTPTGNIWSRYGYPFFGSNISGIDMRVQFKQHEVLSQYDDNEIAIIKN
mgnify:FL=1